MVEIKLTINTIDVVRTSICNDQLNVRFPELIQSPNSKIDSPSIKQKVRESIEKIVEIIINKQLKLFKIFVEKYC